MKMMSLTLRRFALARCALTLFAVAFIVIGGALAAFSQEAPQSQDSSRPAREPQNRAPENDENWLQAYSCNGFMGGLALQYDNVHSPILHTGAMFAITSESRVYEGRTFRQFGQTMSFGILTPEVGLERNVNAGIATVLPQFVFNFAYDVLPEGDRSEDVRLYVGGGAQIMVNLKVNNTFGNSALAFDMYGSLGAFARAERYFTFLGKNWRAASQVSLPLFGAAARPYYSTLTRTAVANDDEVFPLDVQVATLASFPAVSWRTSLDFMLERGHWISVEYLWDYYEHARSHRVQFARHAVGLTMHFRIE